MRAVDCRLYPSRLLPTSCPSLLPLTTVSYYVCYPDYYSLPTLTVSYYVCYQAVESLFTFPHPSLLSLISLCCPLPNTVTCQAGNTALMVAAYNGNIEILKVLLDSGADIDASNKVHETCFLACNSLTMTSSRDRWHATTGIVCESV